MTLEELDKKIAEKVFKLKVVENKTSRGKTFYTIGEPDYYDAEGAMELSNPLPLYSSDMNLAYEVLKQLQGVYDMHSHSEGWTVRIIVRENPFSDRMTWGQAKELAEAICIAATRL